MVLIIMCKKNGLFEKELESYEIVENENLIVSAYAVEAEGYKIYLRISLDRDVEDWEFSAIYDYYDEDIIKPLVTSINAIEDCYNPTWEIEFDFIDSREEMEQKIQQILNCHKDELLDVYNVIKDKKEEYI